MNDTLDRRLERELPRVLIRVIPPTRPRFLELRPDGGRRASRISALRARFGTVAMTAAGVALLGTGGVGAKAALTGSLNPFVWSQAPARSVAPPPPSIGANLGSTAGGAGHGSGLPGGPTLQHGLLQGTDPFASASPSVSASQSSLPQPTHPAMPSPSPKSNRGHVPHGQNQPPGKGRPTP